MPEDSWLSRVQLDEENISPSVRVLKKRILSSRINSDLCYNILENLNLKDPVDKMYLDFYRRNELMMKELYLKMRNYRGSIV